MSGADNHRIRSSRGYGKKHRTLAPKKTPMVRLTRVRPRRKPVSISSLFFKRKEND